MANYEKEMNLESKKLAMTVALAKKYLEDARRSNEERKEIIIEEKKEMREYTSHSVSLSDSDDEGFEAFVDLCQYVNPINEKLIAYDEVENRICMLQQIIKSPYFARIDFKFDDDNEIEKVYIGRSSLKEEKSLNMCVYDWRSPIASVFYRFMLGRVYYDAPAGRVTGEVSLKRQYEIKDSKLEYFFDADVEIVDEFLRQLLSGNASPKMKAIVETIQREQDIAIRDMENDLLMVQGVAGSGKTSIAMHRAAYLMYQGLSDSEKLGSDEIMIISPNTLFEQYISNVLPELGEHNAVSVVFDKLLYMVIKKGRVQTRNQFLESLSLSGSRHRLIENCIAFKTSLQFRKIMDRFLREIPDKWIAFEDILYKGELVLDKEELKRRVVGREETPLGIKLRQLEDFVMDVRDINGMKRIARRDQHSIRKKIREITGIDLLKLYQTLFEDRDYFYNLAHGIELPVDIEEIIEYTKNNLTPDYLHYEDGIALAYITLQFNGNTRYKNIRQVVIDEAQDYYPLQFEIFRLLFTNAKFTILGDIGQTFEKNEELSFYSMIGQVIDKRKSSLITLDKSFRCTSEILNYSLKFTSKNVEIKSFNRKGEEPQVHVAPDQVTFDNMLTDEMQICRDRGYHSIGLLCRNEKNARKLYKRLEKRVDISLFEVGGGVADIQGSFIMPVYLSKGLEFDAVLICDADPDNYRVEEDRNYLYVACTRALHRLTLFAEREASPLL